MSRIVEDGPYSPSDAAPFMTSPTPSRNPRIPLSNHRSNSIPGTGSNISNAARLSQLVSSNKTNRNDAVVSEAGYSTKSTMSVAGSVISRAATRKGKF